MTINGDGRVSFQRTRLGWESYLMTEEEWRERRDKFGVGIKTEGIGKRTTSHLFLSEKKRAPFAGNQRDG